MGIGRGRRAAAACGAGALLVLSVASCGGPEREEADMEVDGVSSAEAPRDGSATAMLGHDQRLQQHMMDMARVPADSLVYVMPTHLEEVGAILDEMEPMTLGIQSDTVWRSTVDSVQNDLARMRDMRAEELRVFMPQHSRRIERLIFLHDSVMGAER